MFDYRSGRVCCEGKRYFVRLLPHYTSDRILQHDIRVSTTSSITYSSYTVSLLGLLKLNLTHSPFLTIISLSMPPARSRKVSRMALMILNKPWWTCIRGRIYHDHGYRSGVALRRKFSGGCCSIKLKIIMVPQRQRQQL